MKYSQAKPGRIFVVRLEDGETLHECIEAFARKMKIRAAALVVLGGADKDSILVVGPDKSRAKKINPMELTLGDAHEISGTGTIFPNSKGEPVLHMHISCGRKKSTVTGCVRRGVKVWHVMEIVIWELTGTSAKRLHDPNTGFELLNPSPGSRDNSK
jgi:predicted DNA-binding protein with PD1-like motif